MKTRRAFLAILSAVSFTGIGRAEPEPEPKEKKGTITGEITRKDGARITVKGEDTTLTLMPHWRGGMPKDGGGLDKEMVGKLEHFKVGDKVKVTWEFEEHYRIVSIVRVEKPADR